MTPPAAFSALDTADIQAFSEAMPIPVAVAHDPDCRVVTGNGAMLRLLGLEAPGDVRSLILAERARFCRDGAPVPGDELPLRQAARGAEPPETEHELRLPGGRALHLLITATPLRRADGQPRGCICSFVDITRQKQQEQALRRNQESLQLALSAARMGYWTWDVRTGVLAWSDDLEAAHGLPPGSFGGTFASFLQIVHPDDRAPVAAAVQEAVDKKSDFDVEFRTMRPGGAPHWMRGVGRLFLGEDGQPARVVGVGIDITARKQAQQELDAANRRMESVLSMLTEAYFALDYDYRFVALNPVAERDVFCRPLAELAGRVLWEAYPAVVGNAFYRHYRKAREELRPQRFEGRSDVSGRWYDASIYPSDGRLHVYMHDITERKLAEQALRLSERSMRLKLERSPLATAVADAAGAIVQINPAFERLLGASLELVRRRSLRQPSPDRTPAFQAAIDQAYAGQPAVVPMRQVIIPLGPHAGEELWVRTHVYPLTDEDGTVREVVFIHEDLTDVKRAEQALARHARELARSNADLEQFAYIAAHDLQEPLRMITSYLQLIERRAGDALDSDARGYLAFSASSARRMQEMVRSVLDYSRIGQSGAGHEEVDMSALLQQALRDLRPQIAAANARIEPEPLPLVRGNAGDLARLLLNLLSNALKFRSAADPEVRVWADRADGGWIFSVADNGVGIPADEGGRLFGLFQRLHPAGRYPGAGIGLASCRKIVEAHGGRIWFEPRPGGGTVFRFMMPDSDLRERAPRGGALAGSNDPRA